MLIVVSTKPGRDLTKTKSWGMINLINCIWKLGEKVVTSYVHKVPCFHAGQYREYKRRAVMDIVACAVIKAERVLGRGGSAAWGFWDVKGRFQNVRWEGLEERMSKSRDSLRWVPGIEQFCGFRQFRVSYDGGVNWRGSTSKWVLQGSPLSPVLFLIWIAPILEEVEGRLGAALSGHVEVLSYVEDIHVGSYTTSAAPAGDEELTGNDWISILDTVMKKVGSKCSLPL